MAVVSSYQKHPVKSGNEQTTPTVASMVSGLMGTLLGTAWQRGGREQR